MLSFTDLPPEVWMAIYNILLQSTLSKTTRIHYRDEDTFNYGDFPTIRQSQFYIRTRREGKAIHIRDIRRPQYNIHDIDDMLFIASTCRLLRAEILALAWSNADIRIRSLELFSDLRYIFYDRMSSESCGFISTLQFGVDLKVCPPSETKEIGVLIRRRLPQMKELTVYIHMDFDPDLGDLMPSVKALGVIPRHIAVEFKRCPAFDPHPSAPSRRRPRYPPWAIVVYDRVYRSAGTALRVLQAELNLISQKRREEQAKREFLDQVCHVLEATVKMRSLMVG
jgi:hypothetical protein